MSSIDTLREFVTLAQCLNYTEAAKLCNITQPALSKHIIALERELKTELLERDRRGVLLTDTGRLLFEGAAHIIDTWDNVSQNIAAQQAKRTIRIGGHLEDTDMSAVLSLVTLIARERYGINAIFGGPEEYNKHLEALKEGAIDVCILSVSKKRLESLDVSYRHLWSLPMIAVMSVSNPLASKKALTWDDLRTETLLKFIGKESSIAFEQIEELCELHGFKAKTHPVLTTKASDCWNTPLSGSVLLWKSTQKELGLLAVSGRRVILPLAEDDANISWYMAFRKEDEELLLDFFEAVEQGRDIVSAKIARRA